MPKGVVSAQKKQSNTKRAIREFHRWNEERYPIYDQNNNLLQVQEDEIFVPVWDYSRKKKDTDGKCYVKVNGSRAYKKERWNYKLQPGESYVLEPKFDQSYYVSNYGNVISFKFNGTDQPLLMAQSEGTSGYLQVGDAWRVHKLVWFSFMAHTIEILQKNPDEKLPYVLPLSYGAELKTLNDLKALIKLDDTEVHHRDSDVKNNALDNLEVLPEDVHDLLTDVKNTDNADIRWEKILESNAMHYYDSDASVIVADEDDAVVQVVDEEELWERIPESAKQEIKNQYWAECAKTVFECVLKQVGFDFFRRDVYMVIKSGNELGYFKFERKDNEIEVQKTPIMAGIDYDIICNEGKIYLPHYIIA